MKLLTGNDRARTALLALALGSLLATTPGCIAGDIEEDSAAGVEQETVAEAASELSTQSWGGHTYMFFTEPNGWVSARDRCASRVGFYLTHINSDAEKNWLRGILPPGTGAWWIGYSDRWNEGDFRWVAGSYGYTNWATGQPDDNNNNEDCAAMGSGNGLWYDFNCSQDRRYICERNY